MTLAQWLTYQSIETKATELRAAGRTFLARGSPSAAVNPHLPVLPHPRAGKLTEADSRPLLSPSLLPGPLESLGSLVADTGQICL